MNLARDPKKRVIEKYQLKRIQRKIKNTLDTERKLNLPNTLLRKRSGRLLKVLCTFKSQPGRSLAILLQYLKNPVPRSPKISPV